MSDFMVNPSVWTTEYVEKIDYKSLNDRARVLGRPLAVRMSGDSLEFYFANKGWWYINSIETGEDALPRIGVKVEPNAYN
jgi:hypothetical protein